MQDGDILWRTELVERDEANIKYTNAVKRKLVLIPALTSQLPQQSKYPRWNSMVSFDRPLTVTYHNVRSSG
jgi:hypothetical protein